MQTLNHKKNELQEVEFYQNKECTVPFDFTNAKDLYIELVYGELTPLVYAIDKALCGTTIYCSYVNNEILVPLKIGAGKKHITIVTLNDITPNLSKYIPEDNAVLFLSEDDLSYYFNNNKKPLPKSTQEQFYRFTSEHVTNGRYNKYKYFIYDLLIRILNDRVYQEEKYVEENDITPHWQSFDSELYLQTLSNQIGLNKLTIFLPHGTQAELQKANEVAKELKEKYGVEEVNLVVLHCFNKLYLGKECLDYDEKPYYDSWYDTDSYVNNMELNGYTYSSDRIYVMKDCWNAYTNFNKIITTNSTGILKPRNTESLQVIDCKEIFEEYLRNN